MNNTPSIDLFFRHTETDAVTGCWLWRGYRDAHGYGRCTVGGKHFHAHRWLYQRYKGPVARGFELDHLCRTPACVNPKHLEAVTHSENVRRWHQQKRSY